MLSTCSRHVVRTPQFARRLTTGTDTAQVPLHTPLTYETLLKIQFLLNKSVESNTTRSQNQRYAKSAGDDANIRANAAVLIPLCNVNDQPGILFQVRGSNLRTHSGQVSFPGGKIDETDNSPEAGAIRETWEELGIPPQNINVLSRMDSWQERSLERLRVLPIVGYISPLQNDDRPPHYSLPSLDISTLALSVIEVAHVFHLSFNEILEPARMRRNLFRGVRPYYTINVSDKIPRATLDDDVQLEVWGLTGWYLWLFMRALGAWQT